MKITIVDNTGELQCDALDKVDASIGSADRCLNYGDGTFTTMYAVGALIFLRQQHFDRIQHDCGKLYIDVDIATLSEILARIQVDYLAQDNQARVIKILVSRGEGGRGYAPPIHSETHCIITISHTALFEPSNFSEHYSYRVGLCPFPLSEQAVLSGLKHANRLEQVLAKRELSEFEFLDDFLMCDTKRNLVEAISANLFFFKEGCWYTPEIDKCGVAGIMRAAIIDFLAQDNHIVKVGHYGVDDLHGCEAMFLTNALRFVIPVSELICENPHTSSSMLFTTSSLVEDLSQNIYLSLFEAAQQSYLELANKL